VRRSLAALALALVVGGAAVALMVRGRPAPAAAVTAVPIGTARVIRTDIVSSQRVNGTLDYGGPFTVTAPAGAPPEQVEQARSGVAADQAALAAAQQAAADIAAGDRLAVAQAESAVATAAPGPGLVQAQQQLATAQQHAQQAEHQAAAQVSTAGLKLQSDEAALGSLQSDARLDGTYTWLPAPGATVSQGQALYAVDGRPVVLLDGAQPAWRDLAPGVSGDDVRQLERDLIDLGFASSADLAVDGSFTGADAAAVDRWQASIGLARTGVVRLGEAVFAAGPLRVAAVRAVLGGQTQPGTAILDLTSTHHVVSAQLPAGQQQLVRQGDRVSVLMPDGHTTVGGTVRDVSRVATAPSQPGQGQGGPPQQAATVTVTITLADEAAAGTLDRAPVFVSITTASRRGVLAVPVTALLAQPDGDYAVAVRSAGSRHLVVVQPGLYGDSGAVEVSGRGLAEGDLVEVPAQ